MKQVTDEFQELNAPIFFVDYEELGFTGVDTDSNPLHILETLESQGDFNFTPLEVLMANATPVPF